jgi:hypothetical protein
MQIVLLILLLINGVSATIGGLMLILDPSGSSLHIPIEWLRDAPFHDYTWPGIILLFSNGLLSLFISWITWKGLMQYAYWALLQGFILCGFLSIEIIMLGVFFAPIHVPNLLVGVSMIIVGFGLQDA